MGAKVFLSIGKFILRDGNDGYDVMQESVVRNTCRFAGRRKVLQDFSIISSRIGHHHEFLGLLNGDNPGH